MTLPYRILRKLGMKEAGYPKRVLDKQVGFQQGFWEKLSADDFLWGYWQDESYFKDIEDLLRKEFTFPEIEDDKNSELLQLIEGTESVAVHVRRGDYLETTDYLNLYDLGYYEKAICRMLKEVDTPTWFVFSDDIEWCKQALCFPGETFYVDGNTGANSFRDMQLMSYCKHNIIANSTFSWWGAWLNSNVKKKVISPEYFYNPNRKSDNKIVCSDWIKIHLMT